ncbi:MAG: Ger(x)C family spore germination protein [Gottschalkiaceae bacterium]|nr:MAG: Ger(x)C family spore germination protein [Gottschalkiaceae bacterium]
MSRRIVFLLLIIILNMSLSGCQSSNEINRLAIITAIGIDKADSQYRITAQIIIPSEISQKYSQGKSPVVVRTVTAPTIFEGIRTMSREATRKLYLSHVQVLVLGEEIARSGIKNIIDFISRDHELRTDFYILVAKNSTAYNILDTLTPIENIPANFIHDSIEVSKKVWGHTKEVQLDELIRILSFKGQSLVLAGIVEIGEDEKGKDVRTLDKVSPPDLLRLQYLAAFKKDKLVGWLENDECKGYSYITSNIESTIETLEEFEKGNIALEIKEAKSKIKVELYEGMPIINVDIKAKASIGEIQIDMDLTKEDNINKIEKMAEDNIQRECRAVIKKAQEELNTDIFGFGEAIYRKHPKIWNDIKEDWSNRFKNITVNITVDVEIKQTGTTTMVLEEREME